MSIQSLWSLRTMYAPSNWELYSLRWRSETVRLVLRPRCSSREFCRWPCRTASVVPIIAGHAAIAAGVLYQYRCRGRVLVR